MIRLIKTSDGTRLPGIQIVDEDGNRLQTLTFAAEATRDAFLIMQEEARLYRQHRLMTKIAEVEANGKDASPLVVTKGSQPLADQKAGVREFIAACQPYNARVAELRRMGFSLGTAAEQARAEREIAGRVGELTAAGFAKPTAAEQAWAEREGAPTPTAKKKHIETVAYLHGVRIEDQTLEELRLASKNGDIPSWVYEQERDRRLQNGAAAPPEPLFSAYLERHVDWSKETFGPALHTDGIIEHIQKELAEVRKDPFDLIEWLDVVILAVDGYWRHGGDPRRIMTLLQAKQDKNVARTWPDWRNVPDGTAIEHDRSND